MDIRSGQTPVPRRPKDRRATLSVVLPNYNCQRQVAEAIEAVAGQSRRPDEFIILDDASTDGSVGVIESYAARHSWIRLERNSRNQGVAAACEKLRQHASCDYIYHGASDDVLLPGFFENAMALAERYPEAGFVCGMIVTTDEEGRERSVLASRCWREPLFARPQRFLEEFLAVERHSLCGATVFRRDAFDEVGGFREELGCSCDTFAWYAIGLKYGVCYLPRRCTKWRDSPTGFYRRTLAQPRRFLDNLGRMAYLMRSRDFRDRFPEHFVRRWHRDMRRMAIREYWRGDNTGQLPPGSSFWRRYRHRLPRTWEALRLAFYRPDLSCYARKATGPLDCGGAVS